MIATRYLFVLGTFLLAMLLYVDRVCISTAQGPISADLKLSDTEFGWALSAFALGYALCQTPTGMLSDRFGPRVVLATVVIAWSLFTGLSGAVTGLTSLLLVRFLFGAGEAGAFPGMARAIYSWIPMRERGIAQGVNFSGGRLGAAFALPAVAAMVESLGWRTSFVILMLVGFVWAAAWFLWFRDDPAEHPGVREEERQLILATRQQAGTSSAGQRHLSAAALFRSGNLGSFVTALAFPYLLAWTGAHETFFYLAAGLNLLAIGLWARVKPDQPLAEL